MNSVERVKEICRERKIPISKLERELGYANGYIGQLKKGVFPDKRLAEIADYFDTTVDYLMGRTDDPENSDRFGLEDPADRSLDIFRNIEKAPTGTGERMSDDELKVALFGSLDVDNADLDDVKRYAAFISDKKRGK